MDLEVRIEADDSELRQLRSQIEAVQQAAKAAKIVIEEIAKQIAVAVTAGCDAVRPMLWDAYLEAGAPYGKSDAGLMRWLNEVSDDGGKNEAG